MSELMIRAADLPELSVERIAALPHEHLQSLDVALAELASWVKAARERMNAALEARYGEAAHKARLAAGKDFGVVHLEDGPLRVTHELRKVVSWDQPRLKEIARRIAEAGDRVEDYLDVELSVPESRYTNWPPALREQFAPARTVKPGKPSFRLALVVKEDA